MAERLGRTSELGDAVRHAVTNALADLHPNAIVFVNLHHDDLDGEALFAKDGPFAKAAKRVVLEFNDRTLLAERVKSLPQRVRALKDLGFSVGLDSGRGSSGSGNVAATEPRFAKLDVALIADVADDAEKQDVIGSCSRSIASWASTPSPSAWSALPTATLCCASGVRCSRATFSGCRTDPLRPTARRAVR